MSTPAVDTLCNTKIAGQRDLTVYRKALGVGRGYFSSGRLVVFSDKFMARFGGAAAIWRWTCVCPKILQAPNEVRQAVIAHEWGHARSGHCLATMGALVAAVVYASSTIFAPQHSWIWTSFNLALLGGVAWMLMWAIQPKREFEADAVASAVLPGGAAQMAAGLRWVVEHMRDGQFSETVIERLARLDRANGRP